MVSHCKRSLELLGLTISHNHSWADHIAKLTSNAKELLTACNVIGVLFSPLDNTSAPYLSLLDAVESKVLRLVSISCDEAEAQDRLFSHGRQIDGFSVFFVSLTPSTRKKKEEISL